MKMFKFNEKQFEVYLPTVVQDEYLQEKVTYPEQPDRTAYISIFKQKLQPLDSTNPEFEKIIYVGLTDELSISVGCKISGSDEEYVVVDCLAVGFKNSLMLEPLN